MNLQIGQEYDERFYFEISRKSFIIMTNNVNINIYINNEHVISIIINLFDRIKYLNMFNY